MLGATQFIMHAHVLRSRHPSAQGACGALIGLVNEYVLPGSVVYVAFHAVRVPGTSFKCVVAVVTCQHVVPYDRTQQ